MTKLGIAIEITNTKAFILIEHMNKYNSYYKILRFAVLFFKIIYFKFIQYTF